MIYHYRFKKGADICSTVTLPVYLPHSKHQCIVGINIELNQMAQFITAGDDLVTDIITSSQWPGPKGLI